MKKELEIGAFFNTEFNENEELKKELKKYIKDMQICQNCTNFKWERQRPRCKELDIELDDNKPCYHFELKE